jgi:cystathionine beta-lyase/cystathionine gamma-synthase
VHHPGLVSHPQHALATVQMRRFGSLLSFELKGGAAAAERLVSRLSLIRPAVSLGGPETLICHPATSTHVGLDDEGRALAGATDGLLRLSTGLEAAGDLVADLASAL